MSFQIAPEVSAPYPGLRPFRRDEAQVFFGRDEQIDDVLGRLKRSQFLGIVGSSGCGKSSLIRAGILPALESGLMGELGSNWFVVDMKPGDSPMTNLAQALVASKVLGELWSNTPESIASLTATLRRSDVSLVNLIRQLNLPKFSNVLILADQFEEIFRFQQQDANEALAFVNLLLATAFDRTVSTYVVMTMRSDFLGQCAVFPGLPEALNDGQYLCPRMTRPQLAEAIERPAIIFGADVKPDLISQLVNDAGANSDQLPLVQHVLARIWNLHTLEDNAASLSAVKDRFLDASVGMTLADYFQTGGLFGVAAQRSLAVTFASATASSGSDEPQNALSRHVDEAYFELGNSRSTNSLIDGTGHHPSAKQWVAQMLFRSLAERGSGGQLVRRPIKVQAIAEIIKEPTESLDSAVTRVIEVVEVFRREDRCFLVPPLGVRLTNESVIDISHEALIRQWRRLAGVGDDQSESAGTTIGWLTIEERARRRYRRLAEAAEAEPTSGLMHDPELSFLNAWWNSFQPRPAWANAVVVNSFHKVDGYLQASLIAARTEANNAAVAAEKVLALERHKVQSTRRLLKVAGMIAAVALVLALFAWRAQVAASKAKAEAQQKSELAAASAVEAKAQNDRAEEMRTQSDQLLYDSQVRAAERELLAGNVANSLSLLDSCRWDFRKWEHDSIASDLFRLRGHNLGVTCIAYSSDGARLITGGKDETVKIWDCDLGTEVRTLSGLNGEVTGVCFGVMDKFAFAASGATVHAWATEDWRQIGPLKYGDGCIEAPISCMTVGKSSHTLVTGHSNGVVTLWDTESGACIQLEREQTKASKITCIDIAPDQKYIAFGSGKTITIYDVKKGKSFVTLVGHTNTVRSIHFSPDSNSLLSGSQDQTLRIWDVHAGAERQAISDQIAVPISVAFNHDGERVACALSDRSVRVWDAVTGGEVTEIRRHTDTVNAICFNPFGDSLASASEDGTITIERAMELDAYRIFREHSTSVRSVALHPDGRTLASSASDGTIILADIETGRVIRTLREHERWVFSIAFSTDGQHFASAGYDRKLLIWDCQSWNSPRLIGEHDGPVRTVAFTADGRSVVSGGYDGKIRLWDCRLGKLLWSQDCGADVLCVSCERTGDRICSAHSDGSIRIWKNLDGSLLSSWNTHHGVALATSFSADGKRIASVGTDSLVKIWDSESSNSILRNSDKVPMRVLSGHTGQVRSVAYFGEGHSLVTGGADGLLKLWDSELGRETHTYVGHDDDVLSVCVGKSGQRIVSGSADKAVVVWNPVNRSINSFGDALLLNGVSDLLCIASSQASGVLAYGSPAGVTMIRNVAAPLMRTTVPVVNPKVITLSLDGANLACCNHESNEIVLIDVRTEECRTLRSNEGPITALRIGAADSRLVSGSDKGVVRIWNLKDSSLVGSFSTGDKKSIEALDVSCDGERVVTGAKDGALQIWQVAGGKLIFELVGHVGAVRTARFVDDETRVLSSGADSTVRFWDANTGLELRNLQATTNAIWELDEVVSKNAIELHSFGRVVQSWQGHRKREVLATHATNGEVARISAGANDRWIVIGDRSGAVEVWSAVSGRSELKLPAHSKAITALAMHPAATSVVSGSSDGEIQFHLLKQDADDLTKDAAPMRKVSLGDGEGAWSMSYLKDGRSVAVGTNLGNVLLLDGSNGEKAATFAAHTSFVKGLQFTDDGRFLVTAGWVKSATSGESDAAASDAESSADAKESSEIKVWQLPASSEPTLTIPVNFAVSGFSLHGNHIAVGSKKGLVQIFNLETGKAMCEPYPAHDNFIHDVEFSPDGSLLASASDDTTIKIWECNVEDDQSLSLSQTRTLVEHEAPVNSITFSHGGTRLVSGGNDGYLRVWLLKELLPLHDWNMKAEPTVVSKFPDAASGVSESAKLPLVIGTDNRSKQSVSVKPNPKPTDVTHQVLLAGFVAFITLITVKGRRKRLREKQNAVLSS